VVQVCSDTHNNAFIPLSIFYAQEYVDISVGKLSTKAVYWDRE